MAEEELFDGMEEILEEFMRESAEIVEKLDEDLVVLEEKPDDLELLNQIFRGFHTIKGSSSFLGLAELTDFSHLAEEMLNKLRKKEMQANPQIIDVLLESIDKIRLFLANIGKEKPEKIDVSSTGKKIKELIEGKPVGQDKDKVKAKEERKPEREKTISAAKSSSQPTVSQQKKEISPTIRVEVERLDNLLNLVGELVLERNRFFQVTRRFKERFEADPLTDDLFSISTQLDLLTTDLHLGVMKARMLPVGNVFKRFPRQVRDLCREKGKDIDLQISGEETELDKSILELISDPLVHLVRNAVDHGIELLEERKRLGKRPEGTLKLRAYHQGNYIHLEISDDGKGMDPELIKRKAVDKKLITSREAEGLSRREALNLIFTPGFSTAEVVTDVSGRGVGMDVVKTNIEKLNGMVDIETELGKGTTISIKLPLTLVIVQVLLVKVAEEVFAIPLSSVVKTLSISPEQIYPIGKKEVIRVQGTILPLVRLNQILNSHSRAGEGNGSRLHAVVVGVAEQRIALLVNTLLGQQEVVIKSLGDYLGHVPGIGGATIMDDGGVILILDIASLVNGR